LALQWAAVLVLAAALPALENLPGTLRPVLRRPMVRYQHWLCLARPVYQPAHPEPLCWEIPRRKPLRSMMLQTPTVCRQELA
jgi:hypothetical protein